MDGFERMLFEYLVTITAPGLAPHLAGVALVVALSLMAVAVAVVLLHVIGVLRFRSASSIRFSSQVPAAPRSRTLRGPVRARAPSADREPARA